MSKQSSLPLSRGVRYTSYLFVFVLLLTGCVAPAFPVATTPAYIEPGLMASTDKTISVIVSASDGATAAKAVRRLGGSVTADLWLVDAVAATIPTAALSRLASIVGIRSVVANTSVSSAQAPTPASDGWDGYVSKKLIRRANQIVGGTALVGMAALDNGGAAALGNNGSLVFFAEDGSEVVRLNLPGNNLPFAPSAGNGVLVVIADHRLNAFNSNGSERWIASISPSEGFTSQATISGNAVYVAVGQKWVHAYDAATGELHWRTQVDGKQLGKVAGAPAVGADGTVYVAFTGEGEDTRGQLYAFASSGTEKFHLTADAGHSFSVPPLAAANGTVYALSKRRVYAVNGDGSQRFRFDLPDDLKGLPTVGADGTLFVSVKTDRLIAINADGSRRFEFRTGGNLETGSVLSAHGSRVYVAKKEKKLFAVDAASGARLWEYTTLGDIAVSPSAQTDGGVGIGDLLGNYAVLAADGSTLSRTSGYPPFTWAATTTAAGTSFVPTGNGVSSVGKLPKKWNGRSDVKNIGEKKVWDLANPFAIDIGADTLHSQGINGNGVTVAVLDSGVYFDDQVKSELGTSVQKLFWGQADFVERQCEVVGDGKKSYVLGLQYEKYCFTGYYNSKDAYGHGTHVAGTIWNQMTDSSTGVSLGVAPETNVLSVRVLDAHGNGSYADAIEGIQYIIQNKDYYGIRVLNLSISAHPTTPYFVDPLNRAVMEAWAAGITVVAAAGNVGPLAESVTVPGNNPYVITVGAVDSQRTPGYWTGDMLPRWSAAGPTFDGFLKPDVLAPGSQIVSFMYNDHSNNSNSAQLVQDHPDYSADISLFRMNGTSMATAVASGVVALMLQAHPNLTPDQVKYRLMGSALPAVTEEAAPLYNRLQQGMGRIWAPAAVLAEFPADAAANQGMDIRWDLSHGYDTPEALSGHYQGPARKMISDDEQSILYYMEGPDGQMYGLGMADAHSGAWLDAETIGERMPAWRDGQITLGSEVKWAGGVSLGAGMPLWSGGMPLWSGGMALWSGGMALWSGGMALWSGNTGTWAEGLPTWSGGMNWAGGMPLWSGGMALWSGGMPLWSGGMALWSGGMPLWSGGMAWAGGMALWSGGMALWSGGLPTWSGSTGSAGLGANEWMHDEDAYETGETSEAPADASTDNASAPEPEPVAPAEPSPEPAPVEQEVQFVHVSDLDNLSYWESSKKWIGAFAVEIADAAGQKMAGAQVAFDITDISGQTLASVQCTTNGQGACLIVTSSQQSRKVDRMTATVRNVTMDGYNYDAAANSDPDGDSNGTTITSYLPDKSRTSPNVPQGQSGNSVAMATFDGGGDIEDRDAAPSVITPEQTVRLFLPAVNR